MSQRIAFKVEGQVQGVNFRNTTVKEAQKLNLTGFVKNDAGGTVSGEAQGDGARIKDFVKYLNQGPSAARVDKVDQSDLESKSGESGFGVH